MATVSILAGPKKVGFLKGAPDPTNADSVPNTSFFDSNWTCQQWIDWHKANVVKYGAPKANQKFVQYASEVSGWASDHFCPYESSFAAYFQDQGINFDNPLASLYVTGTDVATNVESGLTTTSEIAKYLIPLAFLGAAFFVVDKYVYPILPRKDKK